jgi:tRNA pseudouridine38-40 synthase
VNQRNIRLLTAFDGSGYSGWQRQKNAPTIQGTLEQCLATMVDAEVTLHGAGRTDAGVHALGMTANFQTTSAIPCDGFLHGLNSMLPPDIRILDVVEAPEDFHSRYSALGKSYRYDIFTGRIQLPTERLYCAHYPLGFDSSTIHQCLEHIAGTHDFASFEGSGSRDVKKNFARGAVRTLHRATLSPHPAKPDHWSFSFVGDGFLRHMIRNLVGTLMEAGTGRISPSEFQTILQSRDRRTAGPTAPARGLFMVQVFYDSIPG